MLDLELTFLPNFIETGGLFLQVAADVVEPKQPGLPLGLVPVIFILTSTFITPSSSLLRTWPYVLILITTAMFGRYCFPVEKIISLSNPFGDVMSNSYGFHVCCSNSIFKSVRQDSIFIAKKEKRSLNVYGPFGFLRHQLFEIQKSVHTSYILVVFGNSCESLQPSFFVQWYLSWYLKDVICFSCYYHIFIVILWWTMTSVFWRFNFR